MGLTVMVFLIILAGLVYYTKKKVWAAHEPVSGSEIKSVPRASPRKREPFADFSDCGY